MNNITMKTVHGKHIVTHKGESHTFDNLRDAWFYALFIYDWKKEHEKFIKKSQK